MSNSERLESCKELLRRIFVVFPGYREYLRDQPDKGDGTFNAWARMLTSADPESLEFVVEEVCLGNIDVKERFATRDQLPMTLLQHAKAVAGRRRNKEHAERLHTAAHVVYACDDCKDTGIVPCLDPKQLQDVVAGRIDTPETPHLVTYACHCDRGEALRDGVSSPAYKFRPVATFDDKLCFKCYAWCEDIDAPRLKDWVEQFHLRRRDGKLI